MLPGGLKSPNPAVVLRKASDDNLVEAGYLDNTLMVLPPCWDEPGGCPQTMAMHNIAPGTYRLSVEVHDDEYRKTRGAAGSHQVLGYYSGALGASSGTMHADRNSAVTVTINAEAGFQRFELDFF
jgi:hypothetical protein